MKLLFCPKCSDIVRLQRRTRSCICRFVTGAYKPDGDKAWHNGKGLLIGLDNREMGSLALGVKERVEIFRYPQDNGKIEIKGE